MSVLYFPVAIVETVILQLLSVQINSGFFFHLSSVCLFILKDKKVIFHMFPTVDINQKFKVQAS
jgi:hypothetical protein